MLRRITQVRHHLQDGGTEALIADDAVHAREQFLHLAHRLVDTREHRIHARLVLTDEIRAVADIVAAILRWLDVDELLAHDARRADRHMRSLRDADVRANPHRHRHAAAIVLDGLHLADGHAGETDLRLLLETDDLMEAGIDRISLAGTEGKATEPDDERCEQ